MIKQSFLNEFMQLDVYKLIPSKPLIHNIKNSIKYQQITTSIAELELVEPILVYFDKKENEIRILDGHLRVEAMKELGIEKAACIISTLDDTFTPNKHVNHMNPIQEYKMIKKALTKVSVEKLSAVLGISVDNIIGKTNLLTGIDPIVISLLSDKPVPRTTFSILRKMKPIRQIEAVESMIGFDNYSRGLAVSMLDNTPEHLLAKEIKQPLKNNQAKQAMRRLEREMSVTKEETSKIKNEYGANTLKFSIARSYIDSLLSSPKILHWFLENEPQYLTELKNISKINSIDDINPKINEDL
ncbi:plasmid partitioning protein RepB C-terminal domain-containing protein [Enterobacter hormaechei]|uniref:plasmid partitioning protein RepB C-terminal domain-containing protein n=1 Tax=Enterobacter hormaechei TaxID=158836 RepID=UPI001258EE65|nr:plasmid partitioning protein RepB C-terminal domain-containing protein [Enterobacter hormaechei]VAC35691.1 repB Plasmid Partition [Enterobacter hormaechei]VAF71991.1 repB Plasmid Partition [Enterobacter hormaechei]